MFTDSALSPLLNSRQLLVTDIDGVARQLSEVFFKLKLKRFAYHVAAAGAATENRELVVDELTAEIGQDRKSAGEIFVRLLAALGRGAPASEAIRQHAANDFGTAATRRLATQERGEFSCSEVVRRISVSSEVSWGGQNPHRNYEEQPK